MDCDIAQSFYETSEKVFHDMRVLPVEAVRAFDHELRIENVKFGYVGQNIQALFFATKSNGGETRVASKIPADNPCKRLAACRPGK